MWGGLPETAGMQKTAPPNFLGSWLVKARTEAASLGSVPYFLLLLFFNVLVSNYLSRSHRDMGIGGLRRWGRDPHL